MLNSKKKSIINQLDSKLYDLFLNEKTGHDYYHIKRVVNLTARLMPSDDPDYFLAILIAYCHDIFDDKINPSNNIRKDLENLMVKWGIDLSDMIDSIAEGVSEIGYKGGFGKRNKSHAASFVSDADLLDAMGAVGIARTFYYAGANKQHFHDPNLSFVRPDSLESYRNLNRNPIDHFNEKLLVLKDWIVTPQGKIEAEKRHLILENFYKNFIDETSTENDSF